MSVPVVAADGRIYVSFLNTTDLATGRDDYEVVQVCPATGAPVAGPVKVATVIDGGTDYPIAFGRQTYQDSVFRTWAAGNIAADPTNPAHLAVVWSDMRDSATPAPADPYTAKTNSDVIVSQSFNAGSNVVGARPAAARGRPVHAVGRLRPFGPSAHRHVRPLGRSRQPQVRLLTRHRDRTWNAGVHQGRHLDGNFRSPPPAIEWFARTVNPAFPFATAFLGDYSNIAATADGGVVAYWTDMRNDATFAGRTGHGEDAFFAKAS